MRSFIAGLLIAALCGCQSEQPSGAGQEVRIVRDNFGQSVSICGDTALIGAPGNQHAGLESGCRSVEKSQSRRPTGH